MFCRKDGIGMNAKASFSGFERVTKPPTLWRMYSPVNLATPVPRIVSARPVTFWFALSVIVRKLKSADATAPARKAEIIAMRIATKAFELPTPTSAS